MALPEELLKKHPLPWRVAYYRRCEEWDPKSRPHVVDQQGSVVFETLCHVPHPGLPDPVSEMVCQAIVERINATGQDAAVLGAAEEFYRYFQDYLNHEDYELPDCGALKEALEAHGVDLSEEEPGDDLCDMCMCSQVHVDRTTYCGKTIGIECGCEETCDGTCGRETCEECQKGATDDDDEDASETAGTDTTGAASDARGP